MKGKVDRRRGSVPTDVVKEWIQVRCTLAPEKQDVLVALLSDAHIAGFHQTEKFLEFYVPLNQWTVEKKRDLEGVVRSVTGADSDAGKITFGRVPTQNWNAEWERSIKILRPTRRIIIHPSWKTVRGSIRGKIVLTIDPKMSFGTGHHETTRLCLRLLEDRVTKGDNVLDFGTGTGILAIAAVKLGARRALGIDNDPWSIENARENVRRNRVDKSVQILPGSARSVTRSAFDIVVANIDLPTITDTFPTLLRAATSDGVIILSGLMLSDLAATMRLLMKYGGEPEMMIDEGEWMGIVVKRRRSVIVKSERRKGKRV